MATHPVDATLEAAKIDPEERTERLKGIKLDGAGWKLTQIWNTHWHPDHTGGNLALKEATGARVFQAGTRMHDGQLVASGGRVLAVTATGDSVRAAQGMVGSGAAPAGCSSRSRPSSAAKARRASEFYLELDDLVDGVAGGAGELVDDDALGAGDRVEEARLADIGTADNGNSW